MYLTFGRKVSALHLQVLLEMLDTFWATRSLNYVSNIALGGEWVYEEWETNVMACLQIQKHVTRGPADRTAIY